MNNKIKPQKHKSHRRLARELVLQGIYQWRVAGSSVGFIEEQLQSAEDYNKADKKYLTRLFQGVLSDPDTLAEHIQPCLDRPMKELSPVESAILMLSTYELQHFLDIPYNVIINEAIELAKTFGGSDGHKYINGVLDKIANQLRKTEIAAKSSTSQ